MLLKMEPCFFFLDSLQINKINLYQKQHESFTEHDQPTY